ncbi:hypothetical protein [Streptomyces sp. MMS20-AI2-20]|uniref:hypothetical protein n=1 Tax=Streptomyces TaxID=1883 RepID=UPI001F62104F|nr:hypothetical protein [Streptomyces sp. MMS20-AI2-20]MCI4142277.1 hypothetical protein [Streptomyces sp. MMS20-AI2-20]
MNLAWIIAILRPLDVAPHPNFRSSEYDVLPHVQLAGVVSGDPSRSSRYSFDDPNGSPAIDPGVRFAEMSLTSAGIRNGLDGLIQEIKSPNKDHARSCALGLLACCAAAELDEYDTCDSILQNLLGRTAIDTPEGKLVRATLLQQQSLRWRDSGRKHTAHTEETLKLLEAVDGAEFTEFPMGRGATFDHSQSMRHVITSLRHAAWSLVPMRHVVDRPEELPASFPTWQQQVRTERSNQASRIDHLRAMEYSKFVEDSFNIMFRSQSRTFGGRGEATLFYASLNLELLGDLGVLRLRKQNALLKLVQCMNSPHPDADEVADALRLLRNANVKSELDLTVERIRASGPLEALKKEADQILCNRTEPRMLRASELRILRGAADLMTRDEAVNALSLICRVIKAGGAQPAPDSAQLAVVRLEPAWLTAARLANVAEEDDKIALVLLEAAENGRPGDELWDKAIGRSLRDLNWENVSSETQLQWSTFFQRDNSSMAASGSVFYALTSNQAVSRDNEIADLEDVANRVNAVMNGHPVNAEEVSACTEIVKEFLAGIRAEASQGTFAFRALDPADIAAALIIHGNAQDLWPVLTSFLTDRKVQRSDKSGAFDRLSYGATELPPEVARALRHNSRALLSMPGDYFEDDAVVPFPAALRFLASTRIIGEAEAFSLIAKMYGSADVRSREEASRTAATLSMTVASPWLLAQAMQFSHDPEPAVRGHAARALSTFSTLTEFGESAESRLTEMMHEEGVLVPLLAIRQMRQSESAPASAKRAIGGLAVDHPSLIVRREAAALLGEVQ